MTNRIIDADVLLAHLFELYKKDCENILSETKSETDKHWIRAKKRRGQDISKFIENMLETAPTPAPQESIFDADGWCFDLSKAPRQGEILATNGYNVYFGDQFEYWETIEDTGKIKFDLNCEGGRGCVNKIIAWRPMPKPPTGRQS